MPKNWSRNPAFHQPKKYPKIIDSSGFLSLKSCNKSVYNSGFSSAKKHPKISDSSGFLLESCHKFVENSGFSSAQNVSKNQRRFRLFIIEIMPQIFLQFRLFIGKKKGTQKPATIPAFYQNHATNLSIIPAFIGIKNISKNQKQLRLFIIKIIPQTRRQLRLFRKKHIQKSAIIPALIIKIMLHICIVPIIGKKIV